jgi:ketosteroid isomerase-like protein
MSQKNLDLVTRALQAALAQNFAAVNALFHPDHVFLPLTRNVDTGQDFRGGEGFRDFLQDQAVSWNADFEGAVDAVGDKVLAVVTATMRGSSSGATWEERHWCVVSVREGKVWRTEVYGDPAPALEAAGMSE